MDLRDFLFILCIAANLVICAVFGIDSWRRGNEVRLGGYEPWEYVLLALWGLTWVFMSLLTD